MRRMALSALLSVIFFTVVLGLGYGLAFTGVAQLALPRQGGRLEAQRRRQGRRLELIAQSFSKP